MHYKPILQFFAVLAYLVGCNWLYNHVDPWLGIGCLLVLIVYLFNSLITFLKKN